MLPVLWHRFIGTKISKITFSVLNPASHCSMAFRNASLATVVFCTTCCVPPHSETIWANFNSTKVTLTRLPWSSLASCGAAVQSQPFFASRGRAERNHGCLGCLMVNRMIEKIRVNAMINPGPKMIQSHCKKKNGYQPKKTPGFKKKIPSPWLNWWN